MQRYIRNLSTNQIAWKCLFSSEIRQKSPNVQTKRDFIKHLPLTLRFCIEDSFSIKCPLILSSKTSTLLFTSQILPQCCMLHFFHSDGGGEGWGDRIQIGIQPQTHKIIQNWWWLDSTCPLFKKNSSLMSLVPELLQYIAHVNFWRLCHRWSDIFQAIPCCSNIP